MRDKRRKRVGLLRLEQLERRCLLRPVTLGPGEIYCPGMGGSDGGTSGGIISSDHPSDPSGSESGRAVCVFNEGPGTIEADVGEETAELWPVEGGIYSVSVWGVNGAAGNAIWHGDAESLRLDATGDIGPVTVSGDAWLHAGGQILFVQAAELTAEAEGSVGDIRAAKVVELKAARAGVIEVARDAVQIEIVGAVDALRVGRDLESLAARTAGPVSVGRSAGSIDLRGDLVSTIDVGADLGTLSVGGRMDGTVTVGGEIGELRVSGAAVGAVRSGKSVGTVTIGGVAELELAGDADLGLLTLKQGGHVVVRARGAVEAVSAGKRVDLDLIAGRVGGMLFTGGGSLTGEVAGRVASIETGESLRLALTAGQLGALRVEGDVGGTIEVTSTVGTVRATKATGLELVAAAVEGISLEKGGTLVVDLGTLGQVWSGADLSVTGAVDEDLGTLEGKGSLDLNLQVGGAVRSVQSAGRVSGTLQAGAAVTLGSADDWSADVRISGELDELRAGGSVDAGIRVQSVGALTAGGNLSGELVVQRDVQRLATGADLTADVTVGGNFGALEVKGDLEGSVQVEGSLGKVIVGKNLNGSIRSGPVQQAILLTENMDGTIESGELPLLVVGKALAGAVTVNGSVDEIRVGWDRTRSRPSGGTATGATIQVKGDLDRLVVYRGDGVRGDAEGIALAVDGRLGLLDVNGKLTGSIRVGQAVRTIRVGQGADVNLEAGASVGEVLAGGDLRLRATAGGDVGTVRSEGAMQAEIAVEGGIGRIEATGGELVAVLHATGDLGEVMAGRSAELTITARGSLGTVAVGRSGGGNLSGRIEAAQGVRTVMVNDELVRATSVTVPPELSRLQPPDGDARRRGAPALPRRPNRPAPFEHGLFGNAEIEVITAGRVGRILTAGNLQLSLDAGLGVEKLWAGGDLVGVIRAGTADGELVVDSWGSADVVLRADMPVDIAAYDRLRLLADVDGELVAGAWGPVDVSSLQADTARVWSFGPAHVAATTTESLQVAGLDRLELTAAGVGTVSAGAYNSLLATITGKFVSTALASFGDLSVSWTSPAGNAFIYALGDVRASVPDAVDVSITAWGDFTGDVRASGDVELAALGITTGSIVADGSVQIETAAHSGNVTAGDALVVEAHGNVVGDMTAQNFVQAYVHGDLVGKVVSAAGDVELDVSRRVNGTIDAGANISLSAGELEGKIQAGGSVDLELHRASQGEISAGRSFWARFWDDFTGDVTASGTVSLEAYGDYVGELTATDDIRAVVAGDFAGSARAQSVLPHPPDGPRGDEPGLMLYAYGDVRGDLFADGDLELTALGALDGVATARFGRAAVTAGSQMGGGVVANERIDLLAGGTVHGSVQSKGAVKIESLGDVTLEVDARELTVTADTVTATVGDADLVRIGAREDVELTVSDAVRELTVDASGKLDLSGGSFEVLRAFGAAGASVHAANLGDALVSSWGNVELVADGGGDVEVRGEEINVQGASAALSIRTPGRVTGEWTAERDVRIDAVGAVLGSYRTSGSLVVQSGAFVQGRFDAGEILEVSAVKDLSGTFRSRDGGRLRSVVGAFNGDGRTGGDFRVVVPADVRGVLDAGGSLFVAAGGKIDADLRADRSIAVRALDDLDGSVDAGGDVEISLGGSFLGELRAQGGATVVAVGDWRGTAGTGGDMAAFLGGQWVGDIDAEGSVSLQVFDGVTGDIDAGRKVSLVTGASFDGNVNAGGELRVRAGGEVSGALGADGDLSVEALREVRANLKAQGSAYVRTDAWFKGEAKVQGAATVYALAGVQGRVTAGGDAEIAALGPARVTVEADDVLVWSTSDLFVDARATGGVTLIGYGPKLQAILDAGGTLNGWALGDAVVAGRVGGAAELAAFGELTVDLDVGRDYGSFSLGKSIAAVEAGANVSLSSLGPAVMDLSAGGHAQVITVGNVTGEVRAGGQALTATWGSFDDLVIRAEHDVAAIAVRASVLDAESRRGSVDAWLYDGGAVLGRAYRRMQVLSGDDTAVTVRGAADVSLLVDGALGLIMKAVDGASVQATGTIDANVQNSEQVQFVTEGDLGGHVTARDLSLLIGGRGRVEMADVGSLTSAVSVGSLSLLGDAERVAEVLTGGQLELALDVGGCDAVNSSSAGGLGSGDGVTGPGGQTECGVVDELLAREDITGEVSAQWAIKTVRAGERVLASLHSPFVGNVVSYDPVLRTMELPTVEVDTTAIRQQKEHLEGLLPQVSKAVDAVRAEADKLRQEARSLLVRRLAQAESAAADYDREVAVRKDEIRKERERRSERFQSDVDAALARTDLALAEYVGNWNRLRANARWNRAQVQAADTDAEKELGKFVARSRMNAAREKFAHDGGYDALLVLRTSAAQQRADRWIEEFYEAVDEVLAQVQLAGGVASYVPGPVGNIGYAVHLGTSLLRGDWFATGGDVLSAIARASARRHKWLAGAAISAMFDVASYLTSDNGSSGGASSQAAADVVLEEPACFVAGTLVAVVRPVPPGDTTAVWSELAMVTLVGAATTLAVWQQPMCELRSRRAVVLCGPEPLSDRGG